MELFPHQRNPIQCHFKFKIKANSNMQGSGGNNANTQPKMKASTTVATSKNQNPKTRRKNRWKLKFHHQALPAEYLNHYEASLQSSKVASPSSNYTTDDSVVPPPARKAAVSSTSPATATTHFQSVCAPSKTANGTVLIDVPAACAKVNADDSAADCNQRQHDFTTVRYNDLPYMGEMTLDNARPRRGRKPKKADIRHLIYKNYGTTIVDEPLNLCLRDLKSQANANHISMCKFKFTAGAVPSLQEKKIFSVDALNNLKLAGTPYYHHHNHSHHMHYRKEMKRKSRKSLVRERLEKTFREKGFLIQTQQLESAQGATYCKFRQLKKFTRYLFRSWKNHLPGDIINNNAP